MLTMAIILCVLSVFCYGLYYQYYSYISLWIGVVMSFVGVAWEALKGRKETSKLLSTVLFMISLRTLAMWRTKPWGFTVETDSTGGLLLSNLMSELGKWYPGMGLIERESLYSYFPALHVWTVALAKIAVLDPIFIARFLFPVLAGSLTIVLYYLALRPMLTKRVATWASLILCLNPMFVFFDAGYVHESFAMIFYSVYLLVIFRVYFERLREPRYIVIGALAAFAVVLSHHWSAYNLLMISILFLGFPAIYAYLVTVLRQKRLGQAHTISVGFIETTYLIVLPWLSFIALNIFVEHIGLASSFFSSVVDPSVEHPLPAMEPYTPLEKVFISIGVLVLAALGFTELVTGLSRKEKSPKDFLFEYWFIFSSVYIFSATYLIPLSFKGMGIHRRAWPYAFFGLSPLIAKNVAKEYNLRSKLMPKIGLKKSFAQLKPLLLIFPLISCVLLAPSYIHVPSFYLPGDSHFSTSQWIASYLPNGTITVDLTSVTVLQLYGRVNIKPAGDLDQLIPILYQSKDIRFVPEDWRTLVFNKHISVRYPDVSADPSMLNRYCNRIYDSEPLIIFTR